MEAENQPEPRQIVKSDVDDPSSHYFLHHSDSPGLILVSQQLTGENYASWSRAMVIALLVKNKLKFVDGSITKPEGNESDLMNSWTRNNNIVISWILNSISKDISASVIYATSAYEIWNDLKERFQQKNGPRIFQLRKELMNLSQNHDTVSVYFTKLKTIWEELSNYRPHCSCGKCTCDGVKELNVHYQMEYIMSFLMGLNDSFSQVRGQILLSDPLPPINKIFALITQEENQRKVSTHVDAGDVSNNAVAFALKADNRSTAGSVNYGSNMNNRSVAGSANYSPNMRYGVTRNIKKDRPYCSYCKIHGHLVDKCYKIHGYPPGYRMRTRDASGTNNVNQISTSAHTPITGQKEDKKGQQSVLGNFVQNLNPSQYQQLMAMLSSHLATDINISSNDTQENSQNSYVAGIKPGIRGPSMVTGGLIGVMGGFMYVYQNSAGRIMGFFPKEGEVAKYKKHSF